jgi:hypothetical protein
MKKYLKLKYVLPAWLLVGFVAGLITLNVLVEKPPPPEQRTAQYATTLGVHTLGGPISLGAVVWQVVRR